MSTSTALSPMRRLARTLGNLIHHDRIDTNSSISKILEILQKYLNNFDDCWTPLEQQNYLDKCETDIVAVLQHTEMSAATINIVHNEINKAFEEITNDLESFKTIELQDFHDLTTALADLKQTMQQIISRLATELTAVKINVDSLKSEMKDLGNKVMKLEEELDFLKKMHFISDLFSPVMSKLHSMMLINNISQVNKPRS
jgi:chromosome segregation ATPase